MDDGFPPEIKPPTPAEYTVIVVLIAGSLIILGIVGFVFAFRAPPEKHELALALEHYSAWSIGLGVGVALIAWFVRKLTD
jgi:hypothetical protein